MADILEYCKGRKAESFKSGAVLINEGGAERRLFVLIEGSAISRRISAGTGS